MLSLKETALANIKDLVASFSHYDRGDDDELSKDDLEVLIKSDELTRDEILEAFTQELDDWIKEIKND